MRIMGLDLGDKRIGVAVSDPLGFTAQGKAVIESQDKASDIKHISSLAKEYNIEKIVVGLPKNMNNSIGPRAEKTLDFVSLLKKELSIPIITWDERLTTKEAERTLIEADLSRKKRKEVIDKMAAMIILQNYLDSQ